VKHKYIRNLQILDSGFISLISPTLLSSGAMLIYNCILSHLFKKSPVVLCPLFLGVRILARLG